MEYNDENLRRLADHGVRPCATCEASGTLDDGPCPTCHGEKHVRPHPDDCRGLAALALHWRESAERTERDFDALAKEYEALRAELVRLHEHDRDAA